MKNEEVTTIQLTGKKYKRRSIIFICIMIFSVIGMVNGTPKSAEGLGGQGVAFLFFTVSFIGYFVNKIQAWYNHG